MKHYISALVLSFAVLTGNVYGQATDTNTDTQGNQQNGDLNTNTQNTNSTVNSNNTTNSTSNTTQNIGAGAGKATPPPSAIAPSLMSSGSDSCLMSRSGALQIDVLGLSTGAYKQDEECNRRRDAKMFNDLGMKIAAVTRMCQTLENWKAMFEAGSPCPIIVNGKMVFGKRAILIMKQNPALYIPDYDETNFWGTKINKTYYDNILGIGKKDEKNDTNAADERTISERFRTSSRSD